MNREELLAKWGAETPVLDHGHVRLIDVMGNDAAVVQAARVSYGAGTKTVREDRDLIRYLVRQRHTSPLEMIEIKLHVKLPIFVERQWVRHRMASINEVSGRYSELPEEFYVPEADQVCYQSSDNKQGRSGALPLDQANHIRSNMKARGSDEFKHYRFVLEQGVARETARINLPLSTYTEKYWKIDGHNLLHFLSLRADGHAQTEIQKYAEAILKILEDWVPIVHEAFLDYRKYAQTFSRAEMRVLHEVIQDWLDYRREGAIAEGDLNPDDTARLGLLHLIGDSMSKREVREFVEKLGISR